MRQVLSWRLAAALGGVLGALLLVNLLFADRGAVAELTAPFEPVERQPELIELVLDTEHAGFTITDTGQASTDLVLNLADGRQLRVFAGTPGTSTCPDLASIGGCALLAELLGDTISWFALVPMSANFRFQLPPIEGLDGGLAQLTNGWALPYADIIDRSACPAADSFGEFLEATGSGHRSIFDLGQGRITAVTCADGD